MTITEKILSGINLAELTAIDVDRLKPVSDRKV